MGIAIGITTITAGAMYGVIGAQSYYPMAGLAVASAILGLLLYPAQPEHLSSHPHNRNDMTTTITILLTSVFATAFISGVLSLGGGSILMGIFGWILPHFYGNDSAWYHPGSG